MPRRLRDARTLCAENARRVYVDSLKLFRQRAPPWRSTAVSCNARCDEGRAEIWQLVEEHYRTRSATGQLARKRA